MNVREVQAFWLLVVVVMLSSQMKPAVADLLRWNLQNVTFVGGGTASGFFSLDTSQALERPLANFDVKTTAGLLPSAHYTPQDSSGGYGFVIDGGRPQYSALNFITNSGGRALYLLTDLGLGQSRGGTFVLRSTTTLANVDAISEEQDESLSLSGVWYRFVRAGSITTGIPQPPHHGTLVRWSLEGVRFDDGSPAVGSFIYDASQAAVVDFSINLPSYGGGSFNQDVPGDRGGSYAGVSTGPIPGIPILDFSQNHQYGELVQLVPTRPLTDKGGTVDLARGAVAGDIPFFSGSGFRCCGIEENTGLLVSGTLVGTVIPEPSILVLLGLGILGVIGYNWRQPGLRPHKRDKTGRELKLTKLLTQSCR